MAAINHKEIEVTWEVCIVLRIAVWSLGDMWLNEKRRPEHKMHTCYESYLYCIQVEPHRYDMEPVKSRTTLITFNFYLQFPRYMSNKNSFTPLTIFDVSLRTLTIDLIEYILCTICFI